MDNLKLPAYPLPIARHNNGTLNTTLDVDDASCGFTKLEKAALMIGQGMAANILYNNITADNFKKLSVTIAKAIIEEANK